MDDVIQTDAGLRSLQSDRSTLIDTLVGQIQFEMQEARRTAGRAARCRAEENMDSAERWASRSNDHFYAANEVLDRLAELALGKTKEGKDG